MRNHHQSIPDRSRPGLPTTASGIAQQGTCGSYATAKHSENKSKKRGGKRVKKQREAWKGRRSLIRVGTLNIGTMTERRRELADMMDRRNVDIRGVFEKYRDCMLCTTTLATVIKALFFKMAQCLVVVKM